MYKNLTRIGIGALTLSILFSLFINYVFYNGLIYQFKYSVTGFFILGLVLDFLTFTALVNLSVRYRYKLLILLCLFSFLVSIFYYYYVYQDIENKEQFANIEQINFYYYLLLIANILMAIGMIYSKSKEDKYLYTLGVLAFIFSVLNLTFSYFESYYVTYILGNLTPFIYLILIKRYYNELGNNTINDPEVLDNDF
ncbi:hypothetical protein [Crocinitomix catalasitica]|uniref:hypothetical protein n=1 Tax=Crocinitomix catalasitica TaxID=184607 RepID=UPI0012F829A3|nr:hypothetical protein [Crocinitomix catalasitica]